MSPRKKQTANRLGRLPQKLDDYRQPGDKPDRDDSVRREAERQALVEQRIQDAMANGEFDNLPGAGKPFRFNPNPYLEPGQEWAFDLLKRNGMAPGWIELGKSIRQQIETARSNLYRARQYTQANPGDELGWQAAIERFTAQLKKINRQIDDFNLIAPSMTVHRRRLNLESELRRLADIDPR
jgi:DnaJ family protein C protein 28